MNESEIIEMFEMEIELKRFLMSEDINRRLCALPEDFVFALMLRVGMGTWFNLLHTLLCEGMKE